MSGLLSLSNCPTSSNLSTYQPSKPLTYLPTHPPISLPAHLLPYFLVASLICLPTYCFT